jgi:hypothetical protein
MGKADEAIEARKQRVIQEVARALDRLRYGAVTVTVQDGVPVFVRVEEQHRVS